MSGTPVDSTRVQSPDDLKLLTVRPVPVFAAGTPVPGLSSWLLERKLGGGGFGEVWLARHAWDAEQNPRAVKFCTDPVARNRLVTHEKNVVLRVMKYAAKHPNVVPLLDCNLDGDTPWLMYEFVEGGTLARAITQWRGLPPRARTDLAVRALHAIAGALGTFHRFDPPLVHRDMKPHNVLMARSVPRITDFGIGGVALRPMDLTTESATEGAPRLPSELRAAGTRIYAPQEQLFGSAPSPRDDVFALGVIAYQMVLADLTTAPGTDAGHELRRLRVPGELVELIVRSAAINPERRPPDAGAWESALAALIHKTDGPSERAHPTGTDPSAAPEAPTDVPPPRTEPEPAPAPPRPADWRVWNEPKPVRRKKSRGSAGWVLGAGLFIVVGLCAGFALLAPHTFLPPGWRLSGPAPGETREFRLPDGVTMTFCWVPPGECQLGSPSAERDTVLKSFGQAPAWLPDEREERRGTFTTNGFWMGRYEVTRSEWAAVMRGPPSAAPGSQLGGDNRAAPEGNTEDGQLPVDSISWVQSREFVDKLNALGGGEKVFGRKGAFALPHEDGWEYACRGGLGNGRPFYFGAGLNGTQANVDGSAPFGTATKGRNVGRPVAVGSYAAQAPHPWGLCDMHGNVWEWCENRYEGMPARVVRGGSWFNQAHDARSANRGWYGPDAQRRDVGVRICWIGER
ncbi:SUMF1/EgtB/PvdO family nonheme iron enzyme [Gemmata sp. G18]|uniref:SUMF1/EgtB/PvdO family nonheme iron enzyme n=1 Tax=Gemmata palustris TaxID=2822762 RepID=A0ABS5BU91_9BACT|nr:bifunctional serine/threonine-protein kinase/formylglycine-generating enzyme family protein [Gemmata palustris]MBP3957225.1 SUMF1/EgtB/PvdO family nonheme iron enzyme [Gemmata palustris]